MFRVATWRLIVLVAISLCVTASESVAQDANINPLFTNWSKFKLGTSVTLVTVTKQNENVISHVTTKLTLKEKNDKEVTIEQASTTVAQGVTMPTSKATFKYQKEFGKAAAAAAQGNAEVSKPKKGTEDLKVGENSFKCDTAETSIKLQGLETVSKSWSNPDVPGTTVKMTSRMSNGISTVMTLKSIDKK